MKTRNSKILILGLAVVLGLVAVVEFKYGWLAKTKVGDESDSEREEIVEEKKLEGIRIGEKELMVEVVDTPKKIRRGLGYRDEIGSDGMLFVMPARMMHGFWMKGMRFPLDMIWIDCGEVGLKMENCKVVDVSENVPVAENPEKPEHTYYPEVQASHVLEVEIGKAGEWNLKIGDEVVLLVGSE